jgi:hypothetical protein
MNGKLQHWDVYAPRSGNDNEKWSYRKALLFMAVASVASWASIILLLYLASRQ